MKPIKTDKQTKYTLELILSEADKMSVHILKSIRENRNKSFVLFALVSSLFSFSFIEVTENQYDYSILLTGSLIGMFYLRKNLFPQTISFNGALPENMINQYFNNFEGEELEKEYLATQIESYNKAMLDNRVEMAKMVNRFKRSALIVLVAFLLFGVIFLLRFTKCLPT